MNQINNTSLPHQMTQKSRSDEKPGPGNNLSPEIIRNMSAKNEEDLQKMSQMHEQLITQILAEEEDVISNHRNHIDNMVDLIKQEMMLLH